MNGFHAPGDGRLNQLGGMYVSGKPLPVELRSQIISLSCLGVRQCDISRQLKVTHGCVSKLLSKYQETGNVDPSQHAGRPRVITAEIERKIDEYREKDPGAFCWELRQHLLRDNVCAVEDVPSLSSISRLVKNKIIHEGSEHNQSGSKEYIKNGNSRQSLTPFSIASILDMNNDDKKDSTKQQCTRNLLLSSVDVRSPPSLERRPHVKENSQSRPQRRERTRFNHIQSVELEREFHKNPYPGIQRRVELASKLAIDESRIQVWFANRRAKGRRAVSKGRPADVFNNLIADRICICSRDPNPSISARFPFLSHSVQRSENASHRHRRPQLYDD